MADWAYLKNSLRPDPVTMSDWIGAFALGWLCCSSWHDSIISMDDPWSWVVLAALAGSVVLRARDFKRRLRAAVPDEPR